MKIGNIIFDSDFDNWNVNTSVFRERVLNKSNLIFIIEDEDGNKFGNYVNAVINKMYPKDGNPSINDKKSFVFIEIKWKIKWNDEIRYYTTTILHFYCMINHMIICL